MRSSDGLDAVDGDVDLGADVLAGDLAVAQRHRHVVEQPDAEADGPLAALDPRVVDDDRRAVGVDGVAVGVDAGPALAQEAVDDVDADGLRSVHVDARAAAVGEVGDRRLLDVDAAGVLDVDADQRGRDQARDARDVEPAQRDVVAVGGVDDDSGRRVGATEHADAAVDAGRSDDLDRLGDRHRPVARGVEDHDLAARIRVGDGDVEAATRRGELAVRRVQAERCNERSLLGGVDGERGGRDERGDEYRYDGNRTHGSLPGSLGFSGPVLRPGRASTDEPVTTSGQAYPQLTLCA